MKHQLLAAPVLVLAAGFAYAGSTRETALDTIDRALQAKDAHTRREAAQALGVLGSMQPYRARLESMLHDKDLRVKLAAVASLAEAEDAPALRDALDDQAPEVRFAAAKALYRMHDPAGRKALVRVLNGDAKTTASFLVAVKRQQVAATPILMVGLRFVPVPGVAVGASVVEKALEKKMANGAAANRAAVALMVGQENDPEVAAALEHALADKNAAVRAAAIQAIALGGNPAMARDAEALIGDKNPTVRLRAAACYMRLSAE